MILEYWLGVHKTGGGTNGGDAPSPGGGNYFRQILLCKNKNKNYKKY